MICRFSHVGEKEMNERMEGRQLREAMELSEQKGSQEMMSDALADVAHCEISCWYFSGVWWCSP